MINQTSLLHGQEPTYFFANNNFAKAIQEETVVVHASLSLMVLENLGHVDLLTYADVSAVKSKTK